MSQEYNNSYKKSRRPRTPRNRPVLVTPDNETLANDQPIQELSPVEKAPAQVAEPVEPAQPTETKARRLPAFFSKVGKNENDEEQKEVDVAQARLARATRNKTASTGKVAAVEKEEPKAAEAKTSQPATKARTAPPSTFKTRYILGIAIYLFAANFIGYGITALLNQFHADSLLAKFTLFGGQVIVRTSTLLFLAILVIILVLLARFDLIPRTLGGTTSQRGSQSSSRNNEAPGTRQIPNAMKQGVKGSDDKLYQEFRQNQRRDKKR